MLLPTKQTVPRVTNESSATQKLRRHLRFAATANWERGTSFSCKRRAALRINKIKHLPTTDNSTHCASIASASVSLTARTGSFSSSASFAALKRRAPATTSYLLSSSSRTRRGAAQFVLDAIEWADRERRQRSHRPEITLEQEDLVKKVLAVNRHTVVVLISSFPFRDRVDRGTCTCGPPHGAQRPGGRKRLWRLQSRRAAWL
jgi:hypothetical protein